MSSSYVCFPIWLYPCLALHWPLFFTTLHFIFSCFPSPIPPLLFSFPLQSIWEYETQPLPSSEIPEIFSVSERIHTHKHTATEADTQTPAKSQMLFSTAPLLEEDTGLLRWSMGPWGWQCRHDCLVFPPHPPWDYRDKTPVATPPNHQGKEKERVVFQFSTFCNLSPSSNVVPVQLSYCSLVEKRGILQSSCLKNVMLLCSG